MNTYFNNISPIRYEGPASKNPLSYRYYNAEQKILGKTMAEHLRLSVCYWHTFCWQGNDNFGSNTFSHPWHISAAPMQHAKQKLDAAFSFIEKLGVPFITFHDRDIAPEGDSLKESIVNLNLIADQMADKMAKTGIQLLWGTANLFSHPRYMAGAATNPDPEIFAFACAQVKAALDITHRLGGANYVLWGGREGYDTILNTDIRQEGAQLARFLQLIVEYKHKIGFKGTLLIEPKPCEPTKHQYDFDSAHVYAFLQKHGLEKEYCVNIEANHATLAGHGFADEVAYACAHNIFGSIDANRGDPQLGWDTDQFPIDIRETAQVLYVILTHGGLTTGGFNFDTKLRRQSIGLDDLFHGHISGIDTLARGLLIAAKMIEQGQLKAFVQKRYQGWQTPEAKYWLSNQSNLQQISQYVMDNKLEPAPVSGRQEMLENWVNNCI